METTTTALSTADWLVRFMLLPAAVIAVIWFLWALPQWLRRSSFRPGEPWVGEPLWVGAPRELAAALHSLEPLHAFPQPLSRSDLASLMIRFPD